MNKRIDILLDQAGLTPMQEMFEPELYRFAELLVKDCASLADTLDEAYQLPCTAGIMMKKHFGVEE